MNRLSRITAGGILAGVAITAALTGTASAITGSTGTSCEVGLGATGSGLFPCATGSSELDSALGSNQQLPAMSAQTTPDYLVYAAYLLIGGCPMGLALQMPCTPTASSQVGLGLSGAASAAVK